MLIDEFSRQELRESQATIHELTSQIQELTREMGSPRNDSNRRRRTREGPEPACVRAPSRWSGTRRGGKAN